MKFILIKLVYWDIYELITEHGCMDKLTLDHMSLVLFCHQDTSSKRYVATTTHSCHDQLLIIDSILVCIVINMLNSCKVILLTLRTFGFRSFSIVNIYDDAFQV